MSIDPNALALAESSHVLDEMAALAYSAGMAEMGDRALRTADRYMECALAIPLVDDEILSPAACPECRVAFGHATDCIDRED